MVNARRENGESRVYNKRQCRKFISRLQGTLMRLYCAEILSVSRSVSYVWFLLYYLALFLSLSPAPIFPSKSILFCRRTVQGFSSLFCIVPLAVVFLYVLRLTRIQNIIINTRMSIAWKNLIKYYLSKHICTHIMT